MEDFLREERAGVINIHILDFNEEPHNRSLKEEGFEDGVEDITRVASDEAYRKALYKEFNID